MVLACAGGEALDLAEASHVMEGFSMTVVAASIVDMFDSFRAHKHQFNDTRVLSRTDVMVLTFRDRRDL